MGVYLYYTGNFWRSLFCLFPFVLQYKLRGSILAWMIILFSFVLQAVSYEFQSKLGNLLGKRTYQYFLVIMEL